MDYRGASIRVGRLLVGVGALLLVLELGLLVLHGVGPLLHPAVLLLTVVACALLFRRIPRLIPSLILVVLGFLAGGFGGTLILLGALIALVGSQI